jgi:hypothetical protein
VASKLNPGATDEDLLLPLPEPFGPTVNKDRAAAICAVTTRLDSVDPKDAQALFSFARLGPSLPPRLGYGVGFLVAREIGKTHTLDQLARLDNVEARPLVEAALHSLAVCPS